MSQDSVSSTQTVPLNMELLADVAIATQEERNVFDSYDGSSQDTVIVNGNMAPVAPEGGNTKTPSGRSNSAKKWCFTYNNYHETDLAPMLQRLQELCVKYVVAREIGESGTPHLQGAIELKKKMRWSTFKLDPRIHWSKCKGSWDENFDYCTKEDGEKWFHGCKPKRPLKRLACEDGLYPWQTSLMNLTVGDPDDRTIHWIWEPNGNTGKTTFMKWLHRFHDAVPLEGKKADILNIALAHPSDMYVYDIERSLESFVSYSSIEKIKNGFFMSGKYEGGIVNCNCPWVIIFANFPPEWNKLSEDRWEVFEIVDQALTPWSPTAPIFNY